MVDFVEKCRIIIENGRNGRFRVERRKAIYKKGDKQTIENYRPVSLQIICGKIFEHLLYNTLLNFFLRIHLIFF